MDHAGFEFKNQLVVQVQQLGDDVVDFAAQEDVAIDDYPESALAVA